jgi:hypothetical protein
MPKPKMPADIWPQWNGGANWSGDLMFQEGGK